MNESIPMRFQNRRGGEVLEMNVRKVTKAERKRLQDQRDAKINGDPDDTQDIVVATDDAMDDTAVDSPDDTED